MRKNLVQTRRRSETGITRRRLHERFWRMVLYLRLRLARIKATPHEIALGFCFGVFAAFLPLLPLQILLGITLAYIARASKVAAFLGTMVSNPLNTIPLHMAFYQIGKHLSPFAVPPFSFFEIELTEIFHVGWRLYVTLSIGALCLAVPSSIGAYFLARKAVETYRTRKKKSPTPPGSPDS